MSHPTPKIFRGKNTAVGCHFLLHRIFPTQGSNLCFLCLLHTRGFFTTVAPGLCKYMYVHVCTSVCLATGQVINCFPQLMSSTFLGILIFSFP